MSTYTMPRTSSFSPIVMPRTPSGVAGLTAVDWDELGFVPQFLGSDGGYHTEADIITETTDGRNLNELWDELNEVLGIHNEPRQGLVGLLTYPVVGTSESVPQAGNFEFEDASEFGVAEGVRMQPAAFEMGFDYTDFDIAVRYTWKYLRDADVRQIQGVHNGVLSADNRLVFRRVMEAIFDNRNRNTDIRRQNFTVYALYNGDGVIPPPYGETTFDGNHTHYYTTSSGASELIDSGDLMDGYNKLKEHGHRIDLGTTVVAVLNQREVDQVRGFRAGVVNNNSVTALYDFIPAPNQPALIVPNSDGLIGERPPSTWNGLQIVGSYGGILIAENDLIPQKYGMMFASGGPQHADNLVGVRQHTNTAFQGLRLIRGNQTGYPLVDSYYARGFGTGIRQRGAGVVFQIKDVASGTTYDIPAQYTRGGGFSA